MPTRKKKPRSIVNRPPELSLPPPILKPTELFSPRDQDSEQRPHQVVEATERFLQLRSRPELKQEEPATREYAARTVEQHPNALLNFNFGSPTSSLFNFWDSGGEADDDEEPERGMSPETKTLKPRLRSPRTLTFKQAALAEPGLNLQRLSKRERAHWHTRNKPKYMHGKTCKLCHKRGHFPSLCPTRVNGQCIRCGVIGHDAQTCNTPQWCGYCKSDKHFGHLCWKKAADEKKREQEALGVLASSFMRDDDDNVESFSKEELRIAGQPTPIMTRPPLSSSEQANAPGRTGWHRLPHSKPDSNISSNPDIVTASDMSDAELLNACHKLFHYDSHNLGSISPLPKFPMTPEKAGMLRSASGDSPQHLRPSVVFLSEAALKFSKVVRDQTGDTLSNDRFTHFFNCFSDVYRMRRRLLKTKDEELSIKLVNQLDNSTDLFAACCDNIVTMGKDCMAACTVPAEQTTYRHRQRLMLGRNFAEWASLSAEEIDQQITGALDPDLQQAYNALTMLHAKVTLWIATLERIKTTADQHPGRVHDEMLATARKIRNMRNQMLANATCDCELRYCVRMYNSEVENHPTLPAATAPPGGAAMATDSPAPLSLTPPTSPLGRISPTTPLSDPYGVYDDGNRNPAPTIVDGAYSDVSEQHDEIQAPAVGVLISHRLSSSSSDSSSSSSSSSSNEQLRPANLKELSNELKKNLTEYKNACAAMGVKPSMPVKSLIKEFNDASNDDEDATGPDPRGRSTSEKKKKKTKLTHRKRAKDQAGGADLSAKEKDKFNKAFDADLEWAKKMNYAEAARADKYKHFLQELAAKSIPHFPNKSSWKLIWSKETTRKAKEYPSTQVVYVHEGAGSKEYFHHPECSVIYCNSTTKDTFIPGIRACPREYAEREFIQPRRTRTTRTSSTCCGNHF